MTLSVLHKDLLKVDLSEASRVLLHEAKALEMLSDSLDESFSNAIKVIESCSGKVIVTGMGKSGHVAHKIQATLASTGTPSIFVHPGEASHGDMGMILKNDVVIALSNSGNTVELADLIKYTKRFDIPLISMTKNADSTLAKASTVALIMPDIEEACPIGLAPTTSTTLMMALGDALASTLLKRKNFSASDFSVFHPGGSLGNKLRKVRDIMHVKSQIPLISNNALMSDALIEMTSKGFGCVGVVDNENALVGIVTDGDLRRHMSSDLAVKKITEVMSASPKTMVADILVEEAISFINKNKITAVFIVESIDSKKPVGVINIHDCLRAG